MNNKYKHQYMRIKAALENEISVDDFLVDKNKYAKKRFCYFKVARFKNNIHIIFALASVPLIPFYFFYQIYVSIFKNKDHIDIDASHNGSVFLSFTLSPKIDQIYKQYAFGIPFIHCISGRKIKFIHTLKLKNILSGYCLALIYALLFVMNKKTRYWLHASSVFELVLFDYYLEHLSNAGFYNIKLTNHYDRWITLISLKKNFDISIIQHGLVSNEFFPDHKLHNVSEVRGFNKEQILIFKNNICLNQDFKVYYLQPSIKVDKKNICDVLIINNPFFTERELSFYKELKSQNLNVKFRPHPLYITKEINICVDENDLCLGGVFPSPALCLCRESTLGHEYSVMGYNMFTWDDDTVWEDVVRNLNK
ncbi:hypothetical protein QLZ26_04475 [Cronobacter universalis]|uniref:hypothetical protein n=1 Tax=Cronobacter universalis TaxID=535744 RepID=UPI0024AED852|nr:hypothetical protein [Cronobacter universalis]MDI7659367.1 hypothetical protein [Cronobacter universalis]